MTSSNYGPRIATENRIDEYRLDRVDWIERSKSCELLDRSAVRAAEELSVARLKATVLIERCSRASMSASRRPPSRFSPHAEAS